MRFLPYAFHAQNHAGHGINTVTTRISITVIIFRLIFNKDINSPPKDGGFHPFRNYKLNPKGRETLCNPKLKNKTINFFFPF
jgi:hypothetical protein